MVWFLAPTVPLATQQFEVLQAQIPAVQTKLICGADNVQAWSETRVWDAILLNVRIVVSTFQILFDAVSHAFVRLDSLSLIVIDEAHNCVKNNSGARLMCEFYWPAKNGGRHVPHILGLTASPLMRSNLDDLENLEATLDAVCKSPSKHRDELIAQVNRPEMLTVEYGSLMDQTANEDPTWTPSMASLKRAYRQLDIRKDPEILRLRAQNTPRSKDALRKAISKMGTYAQRQMRSFYARAQEMYTAVGPWAADYYIHRVISEFLGGSSDLDDEERLYLAAAFQKVEAPPVSEEPDQLSGQVRALIKILDSYQQDSVGIIFVKERATVAVLSHLLSIHPLTRDRYRVGSMVGSSTMPGRKRDFLDLSRKENLFSLQAFRTGKTNLLVATSVLEEGIDVPVCNLVICFDKPSSLKAFIQRRGRARMGASRLYLLVQDASDQVVSAWQDLERQMKEKYEDDMREKKVLEELEDSEIPDYPVLEVESTGARLTIRDAKQHLEHFCATLSSRKFVDWSPYYTIQDLEGKLVEGPSPELLKATVHLPASLAPELRRAESLRAWVSERNACMDAAFQAYARLYRVGLVNENLLPMRESDLVKEIEPRAGTALVREQFDPWPMVAQAWRDNADLCRRRLAFSNQDNDSMRAAFELVLPVPIPDMEPLTLFWDAQHSWLVTMDSNMKQVSRSSGATNGDEPDHTSALLALAFGYRHRYQKSSAGEQYPIRLISLDQNISTLDMGAKDFSVELMCNTALPRLIRDSLDLNHPYYYTDWLPSKPPAELVGRTYHGFEEAPEDVPYVVINNWPKKVGFFRRPAVLKQISSPRSSKLYPRVLPAGQVKVDSIPSVFTHVGMLVPAITRALEVHLVAADLLESRLDTTGITDLSLVVTAITSKTAQGPGNYERIEFLGDSILKFCTTVNALAKNLLWPEGYLSVFKDNTVSNSRLFHSAVEFGLDRYIIYQPFTLHKWRPIYISDLLQDQPAAATRRLPTKTLADVVESLIGASFVSGGTPKALACMSLFLPEVKWQSIEACRKILYEQSPSNTTLPLTMRPVESLIGHTFSNKSLLVEALTHASYNSHDTAACLERLEFLGDAVLDYVVVTKLFSINEPAPLADSDMHLLRTALVNGDILAFLVMEWTTEQERVDVIDSNTDDTNEIDFIRSTIKTPLWFFMRHASADMGVQQRAMSKRHAAMRAPVLAAMHTGTHYPWALLARLQAQKFYSDVFESVLGAVWVDSGGDMAECEKLVERVGILPYLRRLRRDGVHVLHPKEELGRLAGSEKVEYLVDMVVVRDVDGDGGVVEGGGGEREFSCRVMVGERCVAEVGGGVSREEARTRAAEEACRVLKAAGGKGGL
ncbi:hypothetical protein B0T17DRAFT_26977 [Bombardia bombarda]|uniref:Dicer-like protein 2 n=1 Tax=Bombardia bombarda TaxID=252184 RepID=A0AA40CE78_9PEZI|nr:hypothetical protein B0T17DRAFT_26977 [Bombardia bombarda]